jgi:hypothetical protein
MINRASTNGLYVLRPVLKFFMAASLEELVPEKERQQKIVY